MRTFSRLSISFSWLLPKYSNLLRDILRIRAVEFSSANKRSLLRAQSAKSSSIDVRFLRSILFMAA